MPIAEPRPASTVVLIRPSAVPQVEVLLVRRNDTVAFMAGAYVFPGGRVDEADRIDAAAVASRLGESARSRFSDLSSVEELSYRVAAVREMREEAAVTLAVDTLIPIAHWVTPDIEPRRYDTRFFVAKMPDGQVARHDDGEMTALVWLPAAEALDQCRRGEIMLPPPTWTTLKQIARFHTVDEVLDWARAKPIARVQPGFLKSAGKTMLTLPGDPLHPTVPGWDVPEDTRFELEEGKGWRPVRAS
jgi:8-oxo-dGTP pyrophosphatase MutT (NUDIX family)